MPSINMIAPRRAEKKRLESNVRKLLVVILVELFIVIAIGTFLVSQIYRTRSMASSLDVQLTKLQPKVSKIAKYEKATKALEPKLETLNSAKSDTLRWCRMLQDLSVSLPEKTWFTRISTLPVQPSADSLTINLNGISVNQELVGLTMLRLHDYVPDFNSVDLHFTQKSVQGDFTAIEFEVAAAMKLPKKDNKEVAKS